MSESRNPIVHETDMGVQYGALEATSVDKQLQVLEGRVEALTDALNIVGAQLQATVESSLAARLAELELGLFTMEATVEKLRTEQANLRSALTIHQRRVHGIGESNA